MLGLAAEASMSVP